VKKEILLVTLVVAIIGGVTFKMGLNTGRAQSCASFAVPLPSPLSPPAYDDWQKCLDARHKEQLEYVEWRGKHTREFEACAASLEEATRALVHRARVSQ
jgi:hypothetical protein